MSAAENKGTKKKRAHQLQEDDDPVLRALARAPEGPPMTAEERSALAESKALGAPVPASRVSAQLARRCAGN